MIIEVNGGDYRFEVPEKNLTVKNERLYNTETKKFEGIEGDIISFKYKTEHGVGGYKGYVDGYTNGKKVKIRGIDQVHENIIEQEITHISHITKVEEDGVDVEFSID